MEKAVDRGSHRSGKPFQNTVQFVLTPFEEAEVESVHQFRGEAGLIIGKGGDGMEAVLTVVRELKEAGPGRSVVSDESFDVHGGPLYRSHRRD